MPIEIVGLKELRAELKAAALASPREVTAALREGADQVAARARDLAPKGTGETAGQMASTGKAYSTTVSAGVKFRHPGAGVQEFATTYYRQSPGSGGTQARATKSHIRKGHISAKEGGLVEVHMVNVSAPGPSGGRFAYKAVDELAPALMESTFARLSEILECHGWFGGL
jgi:hypothetical protein